MQKQVITQHIKKACIKKNTSKNKQKHTKSPAEGNDEFQTKASEPLEHRS